MEMEPEKDPRILDSSASSSSELQIADADTDLRRNTNVSAKAIEAGAAGPNPSFPAAATATAPADSPLADLSTVTVTAAPVSVNGVGPIPDGGLQAWMQVVGAVVILIDTWGLINTFGVFQAYYETHQLSESSSSDISWIGSIQASLLMLVGVFSGPLFDAGYFRHLLLVGLFLVVFGQFMTSLCVSYWQVFLAQGLCVGIGMGLLFLPSAAIVSQYFSRRRALAIGISSAGSPVAGIIFPIIFSRLEPKIGFGWTTRVIAFILLGISVIPVVFMRTRIPPTGKARALIDRSALRDVPYLVFVSGNLFSFLTLYVPFFYITVLATSQNITSENFAPYLVTLLNAGSVFGRLVPNALADRWGSLNVMLACTAVSAVLAFAWMGIRNEAGSIVFALLYGAFSGGLVSLTPSIFMELSPDLSRVGARMGMGFLVTGTALLIGTPIAGAIVGDFTPGRWLGMMGYGAGGLLLATAFYVGTRVLLYQRNKRWRE
ncbi:major facilitator superfamily domain-containing protein [Apodospora peruviana]|uniref:Major facilitator superfamily domain-containing protein n=1 Tax=Apodospora peruviana TaxID=516989 RepID=A0AAE0IRU4_9PEZI|nr:major facilitator superfamily domain-containing protein [Apodospora peruviana]